jgi:glutamyl-tRNA synthetase
MASRPSVITRFPPSPTGLLHIGRARTALFNYLFARQNNGQLVFRIEDTDKERSKKEYEQDIIESLKWLAISYDSGPFRQSERTEIYQGYVKQMCDAGFAYISKEEPTEEDKAQGRTRTEVIRFKNPNKRIIFHDIIRGEVSFDTTELGDFVIARSLEEPLYHLTVVVDDFLMGVTHIIRGEDGISNTPRQILIQEAIGAPRPFYAHVPLILAKDRSKLSGRHGAVSVTEYRKLGFLPQALVNYLALLGWNPGTDQEIFSMEELVSAFKLDRVQKGGAVFSEEKLRWINKEHMKRLPQEELAHIVEEALIEGGVDNSTIGKAGKGVIAHMIPLALERAETIIEMKDQAKSMMYFFKPPLYKAEDLLWKDEKDPKKIVAHLRSVLTLIEQIPDASDSLNVFTKDEIKKVLWPYADANGRGAVLWPMRYALSGAPKSPDPFTLAEILGKKETMQRIEAAVNVLSDIH